MAKRKHDYEVLLKLTHDEIPAKIVPETGEVLPYNTRPNNVPIDKMIFEPGALFGKMYNNTWKFISTEFTNIELAVTVKLIILSKMNNNSLKPLDDKTTVRELAGILNVGVNKVSAVLNKLFEYGVYGKFEVAKPNVEYTKYWVLNPFLGFRGKIIDSDIVHLFEGTHIHKAFIDPNYTYNKKTLSRKSDKTTKSCHGRVTKKSK